MTVKRLLRRPPAPRLPAWAGSPLRGLVAHRARLLMSMVAVVAGVAFVAGTLIFSATLERSVDRAFDDLGRGTDVIVRPQRAFEPGLGERRRNVPSRLRCWGPSRTWTASRRPAGSSPGSPPSSTGTARSPGPNRRRAWRGTATGTCPCRA
ncbi:hypothetical protein LUX57_12855 [Actinomadura madurae]|uniref:hypothetical protein n=1 Tax=Actinomadura madurae TaxID=1993 RepID=UPI0020D23F47|nr:hypothetical protein [Actinomadura madurae]MCP9965902.1 hypothetical protein [Actinomadura madurae]